MPLRAAGSMPDSAVSRGTEVLRLNKMVLEKASDIKIFLDPFRSRIMRVMKDAGRPMTVKEVAGEIGVVPAKVHYHMKKLESIGVLYVKRTRVINGIVAKYYDFTADSVSLSVHHEEGDGDLSPLLVKTFVGYYDEAKQHFFDLYNSKQGSSDMDDNDGFFYIKSSIPIDVRKLDQLGDEIRDVMEKYRCEGENAADFSVFFSMVRIPEKKP